MEVTGLAVGVVGLAGLFSVCLDSLSRVQSYRSSNTEVHVLDTRFRAARARFEQWGISVGLSQGRVQPDHHPGLEDETINGVIEDILKIIIKAICDEGSAHRRDNESQPQPFASLNQPRRQRLKWALGGKEDRIEQVAMFENLVQQLHNLVRPEMKQTSVVVGQQVPIWAKDVHQMLVKIEEKERAAIRRDVFSWLGRSSPNDKYEDSLEARINTTCKWIFDRPAFTSWLAHDDPCHPSLLWIHAPAGFGKTILCAQIVQYLSTTVDKPVAYFFFASDHESREDPFFVLRSWLSQIATHNDDAFECTRQIWKANSFERASRRALVDLLKQVVTVVPGCCFVVDGLDECSHLGTSDSPVAKFLSEITTAVSDSNTRLLCVSRDEPEIRDVLENHAFFTQYGITVRDVEADIAVLSRFIVDKKLSNKSQEVRTAISEAVTERCQGQFLWVKMQENSIRMGMNRKQLHRVLENTPSGLERLYDQNWGKIMDMAEWERDRVFAVLRWTAFAGRPLTAHEITEAVLITQFEELDPDEYPDTLDDDYVRSEIVWLCGPLLEVRRGSEGSSPGYRTLHIPHFSVREYLVNHLPVPTWIQANGTLQGDYEKVQHTVIARACVQYLSLPQVWEEEYDPDARYESIRCYAVHYWIWHAKLGLPDPSIFELSRGFLRMDAPHFKSLGNYLVGLDKAS
ncbi:Vegetative incompatibility protein HET-E-1 [Fusarium oxysporum f. sp. cubense race 1]|uniref:Vegetative incompatibility protein HET-E-1 n=1 Tax=Fusarium oxysporum f. sp. cubense (strain race 1) TaxID=1229664 RepID=N4TJR0_FUSC1|nr:Vegetative incompatibility protein HET-E-1 [Fusarium oxysporum f. sp. cubense race 1]